MGSQTAAKERRSRRERQYVLVQSGTAAPGSEAYHLGDSTGIINLYHEIYESKNRLEKPNLLRGKVVVIAKVLDLRCICCLWIMMNTHVCLLAASRMNGSSSQGYILIN